MTKNQREACKNLENNPEISFRRADKSSLFVILNKTNYCEKLYSILNDESKFKQLSDELSDKIKKQLNNIISSNNAVANHLKVPKLIGEYHAGNIYGKCKIHKNAQDPFIRPIIRQIPAPTYVIAQELC